MNDSLKRNTFIDISKGVAIFLMLWGHCIQYCGGSNYDFFGNLIFKAIYSFHMPLFALISGYLFFFSFSKRDLKELLTIRLKSLLKPIIFCSVLHFLIFNVLLELKNGNFRLFFTGEWTQYLSSLWFLWSILAASLSIAIIYKKCENIIGRLVLLIVFMAFVGALPNGTLNQYIFPFFTVGFLYAKYKNIIPKYVTYLKYLTLPLFPVMLSFYERKHYIYTSGLVSPEFSTKEMLGINLFRWAIGFVGSVFILILLNWIHILFSNKLKINLFSICLETLGKYSLAFYALSVPLLSSYLPIIFPNILSLFKFPNILVNNFYIYTFGVSLFMALFYSFAIFLVIKLFEKIKIYSVFF